ncbi:MAG: S9 family peptidase [Bacteroidetes bacterium]|nr:S9 family peptidase [Bacteroidota bacterium]
MLNRIYIVSVLALFSCSTQSDNQNNSMSDSSKNFITSEQRLAKQDVIAPNAKVIPHATVIHNLELNDDYFWMRLSDEQKEAKTPDDQTQDVVDYLNAENDYKESALAPTKDFQSELFDEIVGRIVKDDESVPVFYRGYWYYSRYEEGKEYAFDCRKKDSLENPEEMLLDGPQLAEGHSYFAIGGSSISPNNNIIVYGIDTVSRRQYTLRFKDLTTGVVFEDEIPETTGGAVWANDNKTIFYTKKDPVTLRSYRILKHILGTDLSEDVVVYEETDDTFNIGVGKSKSERFIMIGSHSTLSSETRYIDADKPNSEWTVIQARQDDHEYHVSHYGDHFYIQTNAEAKNFKLVKTSIETPSREHWVDVIPHRDDVLFEGTEIFEDFLVIGERKEGLTNIRVKSWDGSEDYYLEFNDPAYMAYVGTNPEFKSTTLRFGYTSLTTPNTTYEHSFDDKSRTQLKQQKVLGGDFNPANYTSERIMVEARDGAQVPVSIVYRKDVKMDGSSPLLLYAYGSYGYSMDPGFSSTRLSLLDRGFVYAMAHIRGGSEMGRNWYEDGKLFKKMNTFNDFIDCGKHLVANNYTSPDHLYAMGGSAGGLLMGAVMNLEPELFNGIVAAVPFVDVINTMLDESIPLTTGDFDEWGNPKNKAYFDYMMSYSPYDNVSNLNYPHTLITTGYWDSQVQYWEPAKWIAKLRDHKQDDNLLIMHCNMETGHGGASGRFARFKETAMEYAFLFMLEGIDK